MPNTPLTHRTLIEREKAQLRRDEMGLDKFIEVTIVVFALLDGAVVLAVYIPRFSIFLGIVSLLAFICLLIIIYLMHILSKYRRDMKDHIYSVKGPLKKYGQMSQDHRMSVAGVVFRITPANPAVWDFFLKHPNGTHVLVLYSPRTKTVWSITER